MNKSAALEGVRVLDLSRVLAGPYCTQLLADLGADVVKVEPPKGDDTRAWGPPFLSDAAGALTDEASYFACANRNKRSIVIDLRAPGGPALVSRLAGASDVVVENFRPGVLAALGIGAAHLRASKPSLIVCSISGFGQTGPRAAEPGYDFAIQAHSGLMSITGEVEGPPSKTGVAIVDVVTGLHAATAILAALRHRDRTGEGQHIDVALFDSALAALVNQAQAVLATGVAPGRLGNAHPSIVPYQTFGTSDGSIAVGVGNDGQFTRLCACLGSDELARDPRYANNALRVRHRDDLIAALALGFRGRTTAEWLEMLGAAEIPCAPVNDVAQAFADPQARARDMRVRVPDNRLGTIELVGSPLKLEVTPPRFDRAPPRLGEHSDEILEERGLAAEDIAALRRDGVVR